LVAATVAVVLVVELSWALAEGQKAAKQIPAAAATRKTGEQIFIFSIPLIQRCRTAPNLHRKSLLSKPFLAGSNVPSRHHCGAPP
jgi:hypothetical protein